MNRGLQPESFLLADEVVVVCMHVLLIPWPGNSFRASFGQGLFNSPDDKWETDMRIGIAQMSSMMSSMIMAEDQVSISVCRQATVRTDVE